MQHLFYIHISLFFTCGKNAYKFLSFISIIFLATILTYALRLNSTPREVRKASTCCRPLEKMSFFAMELYNTSYL